MQERTGQVSYDHDNLTLKYKLDNEFELVYVVAYQKILQLSYVDKFLNNIQLEFRDAYKNRLQLGDYRGEFDFEAIFQEVLRSAEDWARQQAAAPKVMKSFEESQKSKKTVASMIERKGDDKENAKKAKKVESNYRNHNLSWLPPINHRFSSTHQLKYLKPSRWRSLRLTTQSRKRI